MTKYEKRLSAPIKPDTLIELLMVLNGPERVKGGRHALAVTNDEGDYEIVATFGSERDARYTRRIVRSVAHKSCGGPVTLHYVDMDLEMA